MMCWGTVEYVYLSHVHQPSSTHSGGVRLLHALVDYEEDEHGGCDVFAVRSGIGQTRAPTGDRRAHRVLCDSRTWKIFFLLLILISPFLLTLSLVFFFLLFMKAHR